MFSGIPFIWGQKTGTHLPARPVLRDIIQANAFWIVLSNFWTDWNVYPLIKRETIERLCSHWC